MPAVSDTLCAPTVVVCAPVPVPHAAFGVTEGNPLWEEMRDISLRIGASFLVNVALNEQRQITGVFAGDLIAAHRAGIEFVRVSAMQPVAEPFDIVVTTNSGYPLDMNLYQGVKGMSAAARIVQEGLTNIRKHSGARHVMVRLASMSGSVRLVIEDDGRGFYPETLSEASLRFGLKTMNDRARSVGAELHLDSAPEKGTKVTIRLPLVKANHDEAHPATIG